MQKVRVQGLEVLGLRGGGGGGGECNAQPSTLNPQAVQIFKSPVNAFKSRSFGLRVKSFSSKSEVQKRDAALKTLNSKEAHVIGLTSCHLRLVFAHCQFDPWYFSLQPFLGGLGCPKTEHVFDDRPETVKYS